MRPHGKQIKMDSKGVAHDVDALLTPPLFARCVTFLK